MSNARASRLPPDNVHVAYGTPFTQTDLGDDTVKCETCGAYVDVGAELRAHAREHSADTKP